MEKSLSKIPKHVAIIPDGNRRWAKENGKSSLEGHMAGRERTIDLIEKASELGVEVITFWGFSTENWKRSAEEIAYLMKEIFVGGYKKYLDKFREMKCRFIHLGRKDRLPKEVLDALGSLEEESKEFKEKTVCFAIDYGGRDEIKRMVKSLLEKGLSEDEVTDEIISASLDSADIPDIDMIIRTSGENRLSGFMPWQSEYAELFFIPDYFPDLTPEKFEVIVKEFGNRARRFGGDTHKQS
jgi:undecaprenyl diphosphate synthase